VALGEGPRKSVRGVGQERETEDGRMIALKNGWDKTQRWSGDIV